jgi:hypothetical protein
MLIPEGSPGSFSYVLGSIVFIVALLLLLVGLAGFHALQKGNYGRIGRAGFYTIVAAASAQLIAQVGLMFGSTALEFLDFLGFLGVMVGLVLYGVATLQARVLPRWCGVAFILAMPGALAAGILLARIIPESMFTSVFIVFGIVWLALGHALWARREAPASQQAR